MLFRFVALASSLVMLNACAATDTYSSRAKTYNVESDELSNEMLLLNILRASHRLPLQFTDLQSISGTTTAGGGIGLSTPVGGFPAATPRTINPSVSGSVQTVFQAVVLNSQEFYQGVSSPISAVQASYFVRTVKPSDLIFSLLLQRITLYRGDHECKKEAYFAKCALSFANDPRNLQSTGLFQASLTYLIRLGLSIESIPFRSREVHSDVKDGRKVTSEIVKDDDVRTVARFCFRPRDEMAKAAIIGETFLCGPETARRFFLDAKTETDQAPVVRASKDFVEVMTKVVKGVSDQRARDAARGDPADDRDYDDAPGVLAQNLANFEGTNIRFELTPRSTLDVFDYLGSIVAASNAAGRPVGMIRVVVDEHPDRLPCDLAPDRQCDPIFALTPGLTDALVAVGYKGEEFGIPADRRSAGYSALTLAILKQILGLNTSSKNVPVPAIITGTPAL